MEPPLTVTDRASSLSLENDTSAFWLKVLDSVPDPVFVKDRQQRIVWLNQACCEFMKRDRSQVLGKSDYEFFPPEEAQVFGEQDRWVFQTGMTHENEERFTDELGQTHIISTRKALLQDETGDRFVVGTIRDITDRTLQLEQTNVSLHAEIADRQQVEAELLKREAFLSSIYDGVEQSIFVVNDLGKGVFRYAGFNQAVQRKLGMDGNEAIDRTPQECFGQQLGEQICQRYQRCIDAGEPITYEECVVFNGQTIWSLTTLHPIRNAAGKIYRLVGTSLDITDRKQVEEALRRSEERFQKLATNLPGMLYQFILHPDGSMSMPYVSSGCYELYEMTPEQIYAGSERMLEAIHPEDRPLLENAIAVSATTLEPFQWEGRRHTATGKLKWIQAASRPERQEDGTIVWDGLMMDVTRLKQVEAALQQFNEELELRVEQRTQQLQQAIQQLEAEAAERQTAEAALTVSESRFNKLADNVPGMIYQFRLDVDGMSSFPSVSSGCRELFELEPEAIEHSAQLLFDSIHPDDLPSLADATTRSSESLNTLEWEGRFALPLGQLKWMQWVAKPECQTDGSVLWDGLAIDITDRKRAEEAQRHSEAQLRQQAQDLENTLRELQRTQAQLVQSEKLSSLGQLVAGVAHEINNPISFVYGNLIHATDYVKDLLEVIDLYDRYYPQPCLALQERMEEIELEFLRVDLPKLLASMKVGAERIREIVRSLRNFSRLDEAELKEVDLHEGLESTLMILQSRLKATAERPEIQIIKDYGTLPRISCYAGQVNQVLMNVLANAIDAIEESLASGKVRKTKLPPHIQISTAVRDKQWVEICIADNGLGIPEEVRDRLFDPFFTTKAIGKGTGLGLSIAHQVIVDKHEGRLECRSTLGEGSEFIILLPLRLDR
jgi:two-component system, NtrC family, sensor kinase